MPGIFGKCRKNDIYLQKISEMYYKLIREKRDGKAVRGHIYSVEHRFSRSAGIYKEYLTELAPTLENADYLIPALIDRVQVTQSPKFKRLLPILCQVPGSSGIRFHRGTKPEHSRGCILVSADDEQKLTELWLKEQNNHEDTRLETVDATYRSPD